MKRYVFTSFAQHKSTSVEQVEAFVQDCINEFELFVSDGSQFWSARVNRNIGKRTEISENRSKAGKASAEAKKAAALAQQNSTSVQQVSTGVQQNSTKEIKESKEKKDDEGEPSTTPPINPFYSHEKNKELAAADKAFTSAYHQWGLIGDKLPRWLEAFNRMLDHDAKTQKTKDDYRKHFSNWLKYQKYTTTEPEDYSPVGPPQKEITKNVQPSPIKVADAKAIANKYG